MAEDERMSLTIASMSPAVKANAGEFILVAPSQDSEGEMSLSLERHAAGQVKRIGLCGRAASSAWALLVSAFDEGLP